MTLPRSTRPTPLRRTAAALTAVLSLSALAGCSGGDGGGSGDAPADASVEEFCDAYNSLFDDLIGDVDTESPQEPSGEEVVEAVKRWGEQLADAGTPEDMSGEAREGFELMVSTADDLDAEDFATAEDLDKIESQFSEEEKAASKAFDEYAATNCESPFDLPGEVGGDAPSE